MTKLKKMRYADLLELRKSVDEAILERHREERQELTKQLTQLANLFGIKAPSGESSGGKIAKTAAVKKTRTQRVSATKGKKVKPKYRNPAKPEETWTGRGRQPRWLVHELAQDKKIESFLIR